VSRAMLMTGAKSARPTWRPTAPRDIAALVTFLASDAAGQITGQAITVTGGTIMH